MLNTLLDNTVNLYEISFLTWGIKTSQEIRIVGKKKFAIQFILPILLTNYIIDRYNSQLRG